MFSSRVVRSVVLLLALVSLSLSAVIRWNEDEKPDFCKYHDCPKYTVISTNKNYEVRRYETSYWAAVKMSAADFMADGMDSKEAFYKLFHYINGANVESEKMDMTAPVIDYHTADFMIRAFMIPYRLYGKAPAPTNPDVYLFSSPAQTVYVKSYSGEGWMEDNMHVGLLDRLESDLAADNIEMNKDGFYTAGYDGPGVAEAYRYHELWVGGKPNM